MDRGKHPSKLVYPSNYIPPIHLVTLSTDQNNALENWKYGASILGYKYTVLGLGMKWGGWSFRTKEYIKFIKTLPDNSLVILVDGNDILFVRGPEEVWKSFKKIGKPLIFGGEVSCCTGKYANPLAGGEKNKRKQAVEEIQRRKPPTRYCFPNAGCIVGWKDSVLNALETVKDEDDDQAGHLEQYLKDPEYLTIDWGHSIVGNVNKVGVLWCVDCNILDDLPTKELTYWEKKDAKEAIKGDKLIKTYNVYQNKITGGIPCILHFAGKNVYGYNHMGAYLYGAAFRPIEMPAAQSIGKTALMGISGLWKKGSS